jgi:AGCS family alanine or glycine:cation symporter
MTSQADALSAVEVAINRAIGPLAEVANRVVFFTVKIGGLEVPVVVAWLVVASVLLTGWFGFINVRGFPHALRLIRGDYADPAHKGEVSHFGALSAALAGTLGVGNVAGVAMAITLGGAGAVFWMTVTGFFGMSLKFAECALAVKHRQIGEDGLVNGGPMHYLPIAFAKIGLRPVGVGLAVFFALATVLASTSVFQVNQAFVQVKAVTGFESPLLFGLTFALAIGLVIIGGIRSIAGFAGRLVPAIVGIYFLSAAAVLVFRAGAIPGVVVDIFTQAFAPQAFVGGLAGAFVIGVQRAVFAGESGLGSAAIAHAAAKTDKPVAEGFVALIEPFLATAVVCNLTALVILTAGVPITTGAPGGVEIASAAFESVLPWFAPVLAILIALLAYKTTIAWAYYGERAWGWLAGEGRKRRIAFRLGFLTVIALAPMLSPVEAIRFIDATVFAMAVPNIVALYILAPGLRRDLTDYLDRLKTDAAPPAPGRSSEL